MKIYGWNEPVSCRDKDIAFTKIARPFGWLGNMAPHALTYEGNAFHTPEALFQWLRFKGHPDIQDAIMREASPMAAKMIARKNRAKLGRGEQWDEAEIDIDLMRLCLRLKVEQHPYLIPLLLETNSRNLIEDCSARPRESALFWGSVRDMGYWRGRNVLGNLWMELRADLLAKEKC